MFDNATIIAKGMDHAPLGDDVTSLRSVAKTKAALIIARLLAWLFVGTIAMPNTEHLIPFLS